MEYQAIYEPDTQSCGILDLQLLNRCLEHRLPIESLLDGSNLGLQQLFEPKIHITMAQKLIVFNNALIKSKDVGLGLHVGSHARFSDFGVLGYAILGSNTMIDALFMGFKYLRLVGPLLRKKMWVEEGYGYFQADQITDLKRLLPFCSEYWCTAIKSLYEEVMCQPFPSVEMHFPYKEPEYSELYQDIFQCPITFNSNRLEWKFDAKKLFEPLPTANAMTLKMCLSSCDEMLAKVSGSPTLKEKITQMFIERPGQYPPIDTLAKDLGMSSRTLRRHLKAENTSYQAILNHVRLHLAHHYLSSTEMSIEEISAIIGFSDSANFRHAFRQWDGRSPSDYRKSTRK